MSAAMLCVGLTGMAEVCVDEYNTACAIGSGSMPVFGTPAMLALMEKAACNAVAGCLPDGSSTVGASGNIKHMSPTPVGMRVRAEATLTQVDGRRLVFACHAYDEEECVGEGTQTRYIVEESRFLQKAQQKRR